MEVKFELPGNDFVVRQGVAIVSGWDEEGKSKIHIIGYDETQTWEVLGLLSVATRRTNTLMDNMWGRK